MTLKRFARALSGLRPPQEIAQVQSVSLATWVTAYVPGEQPFQIGKHILVNHDVRTWGKLRGRAYPLKPLVVAPRTREPFVVSGGGNRRSFRVDRVCRYTSRATGAGHANACTAGKCAPYPA
jgi:hypothetical protein